MALELFSNASSFISSLLYTRISHFLDRSLQPFLQNKFLILLLLHLQFLFLTHLDEKFRVSLRNIYYQSKRQGQSHIWREVFQPTILVIFIDSLQLYLSENQLSRHLSNENVVVIRKAPFHNPHTPVAQKVTDESSENISQSVQK